MSVASAGTEIQARKRGFSWDIAIVARRALRSVARDPEVTVPAPPYSRVHVRHDGRGS